jgi:putative two-component system response regulator
MTGNHRKTILVVDDIPENIDLLAGSLTPEYRVTFATNGADALTAALSCPAPSLILLDIMMPGMDGHEVCRRLKSDLRTRSIPVIFVSALSDPQDEAYGLELGAVDFLHKPCNPVIVLQRVQIHLQLHNQNMALENKVRARTRELEATRIEIIRRLGRAAEYRDNETGMHVIRMSQACQRLALATGVPPTQAELLSLAAPMHDIGKIGIPDQILLKPAPLNETEWTLMRRHPLIGAEIIGDHESELLVTARNVALTHHERWDGTGYPRGISGEEIPLEGRIAAICDVYDALTSERPYKRAWTQENAVDYIQCRSGHDFEPRLVSHFVELLPEIDEIRACYRDAKSEITCIS